ncbi:MAG TPA: hypothetical protein VLF93_07250 [Candidatus Saccharimonadales bacterium]|nr:hypothetical protein [Candidatus Saccharimonadales bacterium]
MKVKRFLLILDALIICVLLFVLILFFFSHSNKGSFVPYKTADETVLVGPQYKTISDSLITTVNKEGPHAAIAQLRNEMQKDPKVLSSCHELFHIIGRASYNKYNNFSKAMLYRDDTCVSGYVHGVIEAYSWQNKNNNNLMSLCNDTPRGKYSRWSCIHGIGHGLMFSSKSNVPYAIQKCTEFKTFSDQDACYSGVYMQNFNFDPDDNPSKYVSFTDPFQACRLSSNHLDECYVNAPLFYLNYRPGDFTGATKWCGNVPLLYQKNCYEGVGSQIAAQLFSSPHKVELLCDHSPNVSACLTGMMSWYIDYYAALNPAEKICPTFNSSDQKICNQVIANTSSMF